MSDGTMDITQELTKSNNLYSKPKIDYGNGAIDPKSILIDPHNVLNYVGARAKPNQMSANILRHMSRAMKPVAAIVNTRLNQVAKFCRLPRNKTEFGFKISLRDTRREPTKEERKAMNALENFFLFTGWEYSDDREDSFEDFARKTVRDSLILDRFCHPADTKITMADGKQKNIQDVCIGDSVITHNGNTKKVTQLFKRQYTGGISAIQTGTATLWCTDNHPVLSARDGTKSSAWIRFIDNKESALRWVDAGEMQKGDYVVFPKVNFPEESVVIDLADILRSANEDFGYDKKYVWLNHSSSYRRSEGALIKDVARESRIHHATVSKYLKGTYRRIIGGITEQKILDAVKKTGYRRRDRLRVDRYVSLSEWASIFGLYLAEGSCGNNGIAFSFHNKEAEYQDYVLGFFKRLGLWGKKYPHTKKDGCSIFINSKIIQLLFSSLFGVGSHGKRIPKIFFNGKKEDVIKLLSGIFGGDGSVSRNNEIHWGTASEDLAYQTKLLLNKVGIMVNVSVSSKRNFYQVSFGGKYAQKYFKGVLKSRNKPLVNIRNRDAYLADDSFYYWKTKGVVRKTVEDFTVYNFGVEDDHSYIANGITVHNCFEVVPDLRGDIAEFVAVDAATIMPVDPNEYAPRLSIDKSTGRLYQDKIKYIQEFNGQILAEFNSNELCYGIRNPRTDLMHAGYGYSELEVLIETVTGYLFAEAYNIKYFSQGTVPQGILSLVGKYDKETLAMFKQQWNAQVSGVNNAWKVPVLAFEEGNGVNFTPLKATASEMQFHEWLSFLVNESAAVYQIDPEEFGYNTKSGTFNFQGNTSRSDAVRMSQDRGLRPLLTFFFNKLNQKILWKINPDFIIEPVGLDVDDELQKVQIQSQQIQSYKTINEVRKENGEPEFDADWARVPMNPYVITMLQSAKSESNEEDESLDSLFGAMGEEYSNPMEEAGEAGEEAEDKEKGGSESIDLQQGETGEKDKGSVKRASDNQEVTKGVKLTVDNAKTIEQEYIKQASPVDVSPEKPKIFVSGKVKLSFNEDNVLVNKKNKTTMPIVYNGKILYAVLAELSNNDPQTYKEVISALRGAYQKYGDQAGLAFAELLTTVGIRDYSPIG